MNTSLSHPLRFAALAGLVALSVVGCGDTDGKDAVDVGPEDTTPDPPRLDRVEGLITPPVIVAGGVATVTCQALDQYNQPFAAPLDFEVLDSNGVVATDGVVVTGDQVAIQNAGAYRIRCGTTVQPLLDDLAPETLRVDAGPPATVTTSLFLTELTAGDSVSVRCTVQDANGNAAGGETVVQVSPDTGTSIAGRNVKFITAGTFQAVCAMADGSIVADDPVTINVSPGPLQSLVTVLSTNDISAGEEVTVTCPGEDAYGNYVELEKVFMLPIDGISFLDDSRLWLTSTRSGTYSLACAPKEAWVTVQQTPATLTVRPGAPSQLVLDISPERNVYNVGAKVTTTPRLVDAFGNPVPEVGDNLVTEARLAGQLRQTVPTGDKVDLDEEGTWQLSTATGAPWNLSASRTLVADASAPSISIDYPQRGEMVTNTGTQLTVLGTVTDATGGLASVLFNGAPQDVTPGTNSWPLAIPFSARHGLNSFVVEAVDTNGNKTRVAQSFVNAPSYKPANQPFNDGIVAHLSKDFLDDGERDPNNIDDLATLFWKIVSDINIQDFMPSPVTSGGGYDIYLEDLQHGPLSLTLTPSEDTLELTLDIPNISADVEADGFIDVGGELTVNLISLTMQVFVSIENGVPQTTASAAVVTVNGLNLDVHWSINWIINFFEDNARKGVAEGFEGVLRQEVPTIINQALLGLELSQGFSLPAFLPGMQPINLSLEAKPHTAKVSVDGLDLDLSTKVTTLKQVPWSAPGSIERGGCFGIDGGRPTWTNDRRLAFALSNDVLNKILFNVWWGGALEIELGEDAFAGADLSQYNVANLSVTVSGGLPPILTDCRDDGQFYVQLGEMGIDASLTLGGVPMTIGMIAAFETTATVAVDADGNLGLSIGDIDLDGVVMDIVSVDSPLFDEDDELVLIDLLREQLLGSLLQDIAGQSLAGFPLPSIDMGSLDPSLAGQTIELNNITVDRERGYVVLSGDP